MNNDEVYEIKRTWEIPAATPTESGTAILMQFFTKYPSNLEKFSAFKDLPLEELNTNARFKAHALRIIKVFDDSIQSLGHDWAGPKLDEMWTKIATSHFHRQIEKQSFEPKSMHFSLTQNRFNGALCQNLYESFKLTEELYYNGTLSDPELKEVILEVLTAACNLNEKQTEAWIKLMDIVYTIIFTKLDKLNNGEQ